MTAEVVCVGIAVLDEVFAVDDLPAGPGKYRAHHRVEVGGGVAANAAVTVARLGGTARFVGRVGDDEAGERILAGLRAEGVDASAVERVAGEASPVSAVLVDGAGERLIVNHAGPGLFSAGRAGADQVAGAGAVLADMRWKGGSLGALRAARAAGIPAVLDCDHDPAGREELLAAATHVVFALPTLARFTGVPDAPGALAAAAWHTDAWVAATAGAAGVHWLDGGEARHLAAFEVGVVDTLGAGDVFHGAFALALAEGRPVAEALRFAAAAAAIKCTRFGGRAGIPTRAEVDEFLEAR